jgi:hypothetical protein
LPACAGGGGIQALPARGFKRGLASVASAVGRILCGSPDIGLAASRLHPHLDYILNIFLDYVMRLC